MRRLLAMVLSVFMIAGMIPMTAMAAWDEAPFLTLETDYDQDLQQVTASVILSDYADLSALQFNLNYPADKMKLSDTIDIVVTTELTKNDPEVNEASEGEIVFLWFDNDSVGFNGSEHTVMEAVFDVVDGATGEAELTISDFAFADFNGEETVTNEDGVSESTELLVAALEDVALTGSVTTPAKGADDESALSGDNVDVEITWEPELVGGKFVANTAYTVTITVEPENDYFFTDESSVTFDGFSFVKDADVFVAEKTYDATASAALTALRITGADSIAVPTAQPGAAEKAELELAAVGDYDDGQTDVAVDPAWSIDGTAPAGVTLEGSKLVVDNTAAAGSVTVKAELGGVSVPKLITINRDGDALTVLEIAGGVSEVDVPTLEQSGTVTYDNAFTAVGYNQYGQSMSVASVVWTVDPATGLSISDEGKLTVTKDAAAGTATVKATAEGISDTAEVVVKKAAPAVASVKISGNDAVDVPVAKADGTADAATFNYTAVLNDQFGAAYTGDVVWSLEGAPAGVEIDAATGVLTVYSNVEVSSVTVKAECDGKAATKTVALNKAALAVTRVAVSGPDAVIIPKTGSKTADYTAKVFDQYGAEMTGKTVAWSIADHANVSIASATGVVTVKSTAAEAAALAVTATVEGVSGSKNIEIKAKEDASAEFAAAAPASKTYGDADFTLNAEVTVPAGDNGSWSWTSSDETVLGIKSGEDTDSVVIEVLKADAAGATVTAVYESDNYYGDVSATIVVEPKEVTVSGITAEDKKYDGTTAVTLKFDNVTVNGLVAGDDVSATAAGAFGDKDADTAAKDVVISGLALTGADKDNYVLDVDGSQETTSAKINKADLTVGYTGAALTKEYDGNTAYTGELDLTLAGLVASESGAALKANGGTYNSANVAEAAKLVSLGTLSATGFDLNNYNYTLPEINASITAKAVEVAVSGPAKAKYGESFEHTASAALIGSDTAKYKVLYNGAETKPADVNTYAVTATIDNTNYTVSAVTGITSFEIEKADLAITAAVVKEVRYNDTASKTLALSDFGVTVEGTWTAVALDGTTQEILAVEPAAGANTLTYQLKNTLGEADENKAAVYNLTFTPASGNYNLAASKLTVKVIKKFPITGITVKMDNAVYGDTLADPTASTTATGGSWTYVYEGKLSDGSDTAYAATDVKPTNPGTYTVTATYENDTNKGSGSTTFAITKKALEYTGLTVADKVYNGTTTAVAEGTVAYSGVINSDSVDAPAAADSASFTFENEKVGNNKKVIVSGYTNTLSGADAWKYTVSELTELKGNIILPDDPTLLHQDAKRIVSDSIENSYAGYGNGITDVYADAEAVKNALIEEAQKTIPTIGSNIEFHDLEVEELVSGVWEEAHDGATILFPYPTGTSRTTTFVVIHMNDAGTIESLALTKDAYGVIVDAASTSPFAIAWRKGSSGGGGGGGNHDDEQSNFWTEVKKSIEKANTGDTVRVDAEYFDRMPWNVMQALRKNDGVTLTISWAGGNMITIPAGQALKDEAGRLYYPLSYLANYQFAPAVAAPVAAPAQPALSNPTTGGKTINVQASGIEISGGFNPTPSTEGIDEQQAKWETTTLAPAAAAPVTAETTVVTTTADNGSAMAVIAALAAAIAAGAFFFFRKRRAQ